MEAARRQRRQRQSPRLTSSPFPSGLLLRSLPVASTLATHGASPVFDPDARRASWRTRA